MSTSEAQAKETYRATAFADFEPELSAPGATPERLAIPERTRLCHHQRLC